MSGYRNRLNAAIANAEAKLKEQASVLYNEFEEGEKQVALKTEEVFDWNFWNDLIFKIKNPDNVEYGFLKSYAPIALGILILFLIINRMRSK